MRGWTLALVGLGALAVGWVLYFVLQGTPSYAWLLMALGAGLVALAFVLDFRRVKDAATSRPGQFRVSATVSAALAFAIVLVLNTISYGHYLRFDFSQLRQFTLTTQTKEALSKLDIPVEVAAVFPPGATSIIGEHAKNLLSEYQLYTDVLTVHTIDPDVSPDQVRRYGIDQAGAALGVVVFSGPAGRRRVLAPRIATGAEQAFTEAILEVSGSTQKGVYFLVGHGGPRINGEYSLAASGLRDSLFRVAELDLRPGGIVPKDATTLVLPGPRRSLTIEETGVLRSYLANGGGLFVLIDPNPPADVRRVLTELGVTIEDGTLIDPDSHVVPNLDVPLVGRAKNGFALAQTYFPGATAIIPNPEMPRELDIAALVWTSEASWLERDDRNADAPTFDPETDRKGPFAIGVLVPASASEEGGASQGGRLAIFGDSDFATNRHFQNGNNGDLFVSVVSWVTADKRLVTVERKNLNLRRLILSPEAARLVNLSSIGLLPLILFVAGGHLWWRRR